MRRVMMLASLVFMLGFVGVSRVVPRIRDIEVRGANHYSAEQVLALAGVAEGDPLLWVYPQRLRRLQRDPWIERVAVIRELPSTLRLYVWERQPAVVKGDTVIALDGTILPHADPDRGQDRDQDSQEDQPPAPLIQLSGWGEDRSDEAMELLRLLYDFRPQALFYTPSGFHVNLAERQLFTPSLVALQEHWAGFISQQGSSVSVYPWGVSVLP